MKPGLLSLILCTGLLGIVCADSPSALPVPPENTLSPDKRYGITVPSIFDESMEGRWFGENKLIEMGTKRVLGEINAWTAYAHENHVDILPVWWSRDSAYALWQVEGKWGKQSQVLIALQSGEIAWELDVLTALQRAILTRTEAVDPKKFLEAKKRNWGDGSGYPEKFTVEAVADHSNEGSLTFPVCLRVYLTSNPKSIPSIPQVDSSMEATLNKDGMITVTGFRMGKSVARVKDLPWIW